MGRIVPVVVATGFGTIETAVAAMRRGAVNYVLKPLIGDDLIQQVDLGLAHAASTSIAAHPHAHAATRWAQAVADFIGAREDARTLGQWARSVGLSASTLRTCCQMAGVSAKRALTLARLVRAVYQSRHVTWQPRQRLNVTDPRTLHRILASGGLSASATRVSLGDLLARQSLVHDRDALHALRAALSNSDPSLQLDSAS
jgi:DNA-binding response OmpR family regulator